MEATDDDNGFASHWSQGLSVGVYLLEIKAWSRPAYDGSWDNGIDVLKVTTLWSVKTWRGDGGEHD